MLKPTLNRVIILPDEIPETTASGIILKQDVKEPPKQGTVVAVGRDATQVKEGDRVVFPAYGGQTVAYEGIKYLVMPEDDVIGVLEG